MRERAKQAELRGDLAAAIDQWAAGESPEDVARVMLVLGDAELAPDARMKRYTQAVAVAPPGTDIHRQARVRRAELIVAITHGEALSGVAKRDLLLAAKEFEECNEPEKAAATYARLKDVEGEARALAQAGDVEMLERVLTGEQEKDRLAREKRRLFSEAEILAASGDRRGAVACFSDLLKVAPNDPVATDRLQMLNGRKKRGPRVDLIVDGSPWSVILGNEVVIGRTEGSLLISSSAVSREHLKIVRVGSDVQILDLESRNGTQMRGMPIRGAMPIHDGVEITLGREVPIRISPSVRMPGAIDIEALGTVYIAPLGPLALPMGWTIDSASDGWLTLAIDRTPAFLGGVATKEAVSLLVGDAFSKGRGEEPCLRVAG